jgi:SAM-dependent methyltransferase
LLWVIPLSLYLLTFVLAFARRRFVSTRTWGLILPFTTVAVVMTILGVVTIPIWARLGINYLNFFVAAMVAHSQLADDRPKPAQLTTFYLVIAVGGVLGGAFNAIAAPFLFDAILEYPLALVLAVLLVPAGMGGASAATPPSETARARRLDLLVPLGLFVVILVALLVSARFGLVSGALIVALGVVGSLAFVRRPTRFGLSLAGMLAIIFLAGQPAVFADRTFFGLSRVVADADGRHVFLSGATIHGKGRTEPGGGQEPMSYYHPSGPAGQVFAELASRSEVATVGAGAAGVGAGAASGAGRGERIAIVGLGAGGLAAYGRPGQEYTFVEIDPVVIRIAEDPRLFRFLSDSAATVRVEEADGRLWLEAQPDGTFDLIVVDAFSSDAIPAHLVTREAVAMYVRKLRPGGRLLFNVTNSYLDVRSVVAGAATALGLAGVQRSDADLGAAPPGDKEISQWVVLAPERANLGELASDPNWTPIQDGPTELWTDDFSDILSVIR